MSQPSVIAVFDSRDRLEPAIQALIGTGFDRSQVSLLTSSTSLETVRRGQEVPERDLETPVDRADTGNVQGLVSGIPAYLAAVLAAGVTVASGGTLAGVALAAVGGGAAGGLLGAGAAKYFGDTVDERYEAQLARGGIVVVVSPLDEAQLRRAETTLAQQGARDVTRRRSDPEVKGATTQHGLGRDARGGRDGRDNDGDGDSA